MPDASISLNVKKQHLKADRRQSTFIADGGSLLPASALPPGHSRPAALVWPLSSGSRPL